MLAALIKAGGYLLDEGQVALLEETYWQDGKMNRHMMAQDIDKVLAALSIDDANDDVRFLIAPTDKSTKADKISGEKMALFFALYRAPDFLAAACLAQEIQDGQGAGHSVGIHTTDDVKAHYLALHLPTCRVIVNQAHCFATGGSFDNGLPFSLSMGCGSWGGNGIDENFNWTHLVNQTRIARPIPPAEPTIDEIFGAYFKATGQ